MQLVFWAWFLLIPSIIAVLFFWPELLTLAQRIRGKYQPAPPFPCTLTNDPTILRCTLPHNHPGPCFIEVGIISGGGS